MAENSATPHGEELVGSQHATNGRAGGTKPIGDIEGDTSGKHVAKGSSSGTQLVHVILRGTSAEEEEWYKYACRIVEEPAIDDFQGVHPD